MGEVGGKNIKTQKQTYINNSLSYARCGMRFLEDSKYDKGSNDELKADIHNSVQRWKVRRGPT